MKLSKGVQGKESILNVVLNKHANPVSTVGSASRCASV